MFLSPTPDVAFGSPGWRLVWEEAGITFGHAPTNARSGTVEVALSEDVMLRNASLFAHVFVTKDGASMDPGDGAYDPTATAHMVAGTPPPRHAHTPTQARTHGSPQPPHLS